MNRLTIGSIITATLLLVGCGSNGSSNSTSSSLSDSSTPANSGNSNVANKIGKGYYVDSAVEGVNYQCGNERGTTDENGTFTFESGSDCNFTLGRVKLRDINASLLEDNITILETNETVAQLLQTLDSDGNASNGIQIPKVAESVLDETIPSLDDLDQDLLEVIHDRLKTEDSNEYHGKVIDRNQTVVHLNRTKVELEERHIRTHLDIEAEHRARRDNNDNTHRGDANETIHNNSPIDNNRVDTHRGDANETIHNNSSIDTDNNGVEDMRGGKGDINSHNNNQRQEQSNNSSSQNNSRNNSSMPVVGNGNSSNSQEQEHSGSSSSQDNGSNNSSTPSVTNTSSNMGNSNSSNGGEGHLNSSSLQDNSSNNSSTPSAENRSSNMRNNNSSNSQEQEHSDSSSSHSQSNSSEGDSSSSSSNSSESSSHTSQTRGMRNFDRR